MLITIYSILCLRTIAISGYLPVIFTTSLYTVWMLQRKHWYCFISSSPFAAVECLTDNSPRCWLVLWCWVCDSVHVICDNSSWLWCTANLMIIAQSLNILVYNMHDSLHEINEKTRQLFIYANERISNDVKIHYNRMKTLNNRLSDNLMFDI